MAPSKTEAFERLEEAAHSNPHISEALARTLNELKREGAEDFADLDAKAKALLVIKRDLKVAKMQPGAPRDPGEASEAPAVAEEFAL